MPQMWPMLWEALFYISLTMLYLQVNKFLFMKFNMSEKMTNPTKSMKLIPMKW